MGTPGRRTLLEFSRLGQLHKCPENVALEVPLPLQPTATHSHTYKPDSMALRPCYLEWVCYQVFLEGISVSRLFIPISRYARWMTETETARLQLICVADRGTNKGCILETTQDSYSRNCIRQEWLKFCEVLWKHTEFVEGMGNMALKQKKRFISIKKKCLTNLYVAEDMQ